MYKRIQVSWKILNEQKSSPQNGVCSQNLLNSNFNVIRSCFEICGNFEVKKKTTGVLRIIIIIIVLSCVRRQIKPLRLTLAVRRIGRKDAHMIMN